MQPRAFFLLSDSLIYARPTLDSSALTRWHTALGRYLTGSPQGTQGSGDPLPASFPDEYGVVYTHGPPPGDRSLRPLSTCSSSSCSSNSASASGSSTPPSPPVDLFAGHPLLFRARFDLAECTLVAIDDRMSTGPSGGGVTSDWGPSPDSPSTDRPLLPRSRTASRTRTNSTASTRILSPPHPATPPSRPGSSSGTWHSGQYAFELRTPKKSFAIYAPDAETKKWWIDKIRSTRTAYLQSKRRLESSSPPPPPPSASSRSLSLTVLPRGPSPLGLDAPPSPRRPASGRRSRPASYASATTLASIDDAPGEEPGIGGSSAGAGAGVAAVAVPSPPIASQPWTSERDRRSSIASLSSGALETLNSFFTRRASDDASLSATGRRSVPPAGIPGILHRGSSSPAPPVWVPMLEEYNAPVWVPDNTRDTCALCLEPFTLFRRKHHCRLCGRIVCGTCSTRKFAIASYDGEQDRDAHDAPPVAERRISAASTPPPRTRCASDLDLPLPPSSTSRTGHPSIYTSVASASGPSPSPGLARACDPCFTATFPDFVHDSPSDPAYVDADLDDPRAAKPLSPQLGLGLAADSTAHLTASAAVPMTARSTSLSHPSRPAFASYAHTHAHERVRLASSRSAQAHFSSSPAPARASGRFPSLSRTASGTSGTSGTSGQTATPTTISSVGMTSGTSSQAEAGEEKIAFPSVDALGSASSPPMHSLNAQEQEAPPEASDATPRRASCTDTAAALQPRSAGGKLLGGSRIEALLYPAQVHAATSGTATLRLATTKGTITPEDWDVSSSSSPSADPGVIHSHTKTKDFEASEARSTTGPASKHSGATFSSASNGALPFPALPSPDPQTGSRSREEGTSSIRTGGYFDLPLSDSARPRSPGAESSSTTLLLTPKGTHGETTGAFEELNPPTPRPLAHSLSSYPRPPVSDQQGPSSGNRRDRPVSASYSLTSTPSFFPISLPSARMHRERNVSLALPPSVSGVTVRRTRPSTAREPAPLALRRTVTTHDIPSSASASSIANSGVWRLPPLSPVPASPSRLDSRPHHRDSLAHERDREHEPSPPDPPPSGPPLPRRRKHLSAVARLTNVYNSFTRAPPN